MSIDATPGPAVGIAFCGYVPGLLAKKPGLVDFIELPFELLQHRPETFKHCDNYRMVIHCASLSLAGENRVSKKTVDSLQYWINLTKTPWVGEHVAYIAATDTRAARNGATPVYDIGYAISPPFNRESLKRVVDNICCYEECLSVPMIIENAPLYCRIPTTNMDQAEFMLEIIRRTKAGILLDLSHLYISAHNLGVDPFDALASFPVESVVEVHISGFDKQFDGLWDDHARRAPDIIFGLLEELLKRGVPDAITFEYNWSVSFPASYLIEDIQRVRSLVCENATYGG